MDQSGKYTGKGFKRTPQRLAIFDYLLGNIAHPSAEDVYQAVKSRVRGISFATVYNTLNALREAGSLRELSIDPTRKRYDPNVAPHHHIICVRCRRIDDVPELLTVAPPAALANNYSILASHIEFYGICSSCRNSAAAT